MVRNTATVVEYALSLPLMLWYGGRLLVRRGEGMEEGRAGGREKKRGEGGREKKGRAGGRENKGGTGTEGDWEGGSRREGATRNRERWKIPEDRDIFHKHWTKYGEREAILRSCFGAYGALSCFVSRTSSVTRTSPPPYA